MTRRFFRPLLILIVLISSLAGGQTNIPGGSEAPPSSTRIPLMLPADSKSLEPISSFMPTYPPNAEADKLHGPIVIKIVVSAKGGVTSTEIISGNPLLAQAAVTAVTKWKFKPFIRNGIEVTASTDLPFNFIYCDQLPAANPKPEDTLNRVPNAINVIRISRAVAEQLITHKVKPEYPELAALARIQGTVLLTGAIDKTAGLKSSACSAVTPC